MYTRRVVFGVQGFVGHLCGELLLQRINPLSYQSWDARQSQVGCELLGLIAQCSYFCFYLGRGNPDRLLANNCSIAHSRKGQLQIGERKDEAWSRSALGL